MEKQIREWLMQAEYDLNSAQYMFNGGRYIYAVFLCHLTIEKALKAVYIFQMESIPPKTHSLSYLMEKSSVKLESKLDDFIFTLNDAGIATRYPENLSKLSSEYTDKVTSTILVKTKEVLECLKEMLKK